MKLIECDCKYVPEELGIDGMYNMMEKAARVCYKSENLIKAGSARRLIDNAIIPLGHTSILEFGTVYLTGDTRNQNDKWWEKYIDNRFSRVVFNGDSVYVTTNYCVIMQGDYENIKDAIKNNYDKNWKEDINSYYTNPTEYHKRRYCVRMTMDRVGSQSVERQRGKYGNSFAQESTRFVNYTLGKNGGEIVIAAPNKMFSLLGTRDVDDVNEESERLRKIDEGWDLYVSAMEYLDNVYSRLINEFNWHTDDARGVLPLDVKTEFLMMGYIEDWEVFFFRRDDKKAHKQIQYIARKLKEIFKQNNIYE